MCRSNDVKYKFSPAFTLFMVLFVCSGLTFFVGWAFYEAIEIILN